MRIPTEHFTATPVFALSPTTNIANNYESNQYNSMIHHGSSNQSTQKSQPLQFTSLCVTNCQKSVIPKSVQREKKISLPASLGLLGRTNNLQSVGSAPSSPTLSRSPSCESGDTNSETQFDFPTVQENKFGNEITRSNGDSFPRPHISTIFGSENTGNFGTSTQGVVLRNKKPRETSGISSKYATLPRKYETYTKICQSIIKPCKLMFSLLSIKCELFCFLCCKF